MKAAPAEKHDEVTTRNRIFNVAARLMAHKGYNAVSMREISEQSGVTKPTIYYYFQSKENLYQELLDTALSHGDSLVREVLGRSTSVKQKLADLLKLRFRLSLAYPDMAQFFVHLFVHLEDTPITERLMKEAKPRRKILKDMIQEGINSGEFGTSVNPDLAVEIFIGASVHFILRQLASRSKILSDQLADEIVEVLFKGLNE